MIQGNEVVKKSSRLYNNSYILFSGHLFNSELIEAAVAPTTSSLILSTFDGLGSVPFLADFNHPCLKNAKNFCQWTI